MANRNYTAGRNFEYRIIRRLRAVGFYCIRSYASKGIADIVAVPPVPGPALLIQAKKTKGGYVRPDERTGLEKLAAHTGGIVCVMYPAAGTLRADVVTPGLEWIDVDLDCLLEKIGLINAPCPNTTNGETW